MASDSNQTTESLDRRKFIGKAVTGAATAGLVGSAAACGGPAAEGGPAVQTRPNVMWRLASSFPRSLDTLFGSAERLSERLAALTDNRFQIRPYPSPELVPGLQVMDAVQQGTVQVGHSPGYYYVGKTAALAFDTGLPFGLTARQQDAWLYQGGGLELMQGVYSDFGILSLPAGNTGSQMGGWFKREVRTAQDLKGLKMRIPGLGAEVMNRLGVTVQVLAAGDIYPALERGAIDATEWVGPYDDEKLGFQNAAKIYYYPGWWEPGPSMSFMINRAAWDQLPSAYQDAFRAAALHAGSQTLAIYDTKNPQALDRLLAQGVQLRRFSTEIMSVAKQASEAIVEENAAADATYRKIYEAWKKFRDDSFRWFGTSEQAYAEFAFGSGSTA